jgi:hypothetical protein
MTVKFIERVGLRDSSALVVIGEKESKADPYTVFRAFNYDLKTKTKSPVRGKDAEWFWMWHVEKVTHLTSAAETDIVFHFLDCTECEAEQLLAAFQYAPSTGKWDVLQWSEQDGPALLIGSDPQYGDEFYYYDCLHTVSDTTGDGVEDVAVRCRTSGQADPENPAKRIIKDETLLYTAQRGTLTRIVVTKGSQYFSQVQQALCATSKRSSSLCLKPRPAHAGQRKE